MHVSRARCTHAHTPCMHIHSYAYTHEHVHTSTHTCTHVHERAHICMHIHTCMWAYTHTHIHTYVQAYTHHVTHTCIHAHITCVRSVRLCAEVSFLGRTSSERKSPPNEFSPTKIQSNTILDKFFFIFFSLIISELRIIFTCVVTCRVTFCSVWHYIFRTPNEVTQIWQATHMGMNNKTFSLVSVCDSTSESNEGTE